MKKVVMTSGREYIVSDDIANKLVSGTDIRFKRGESGALINPSMVESVGSLSVEEETVPEPEVVATFKCDICGAAPFKDARALNAHKRGAHWNKKKEEIEKEV